MSEPPEPTPLEIAAHDNRETWWKDLVIVLLLTFFGALAYAVDSTSDDVRLHGSALFTATVAIYGLLRFSFWPRGKSPADASWIRPVSVVVTGAIFVPVVLLNPALSRPDLVDPVLMLILGGMWLAWTFRASRS